MSSPSKTDVVALQTEVEQLRAKVRELEREAGGGVSPQSMRTRSLVGTGVSFGGDDEDVDTATDQVKTMGMRRRMASHGSLRDVDGELKKPVVEKLVVSEDDELDPDEGGMNLWFTPKKEQKEFTAATVPMHEPLSIVIFGATGDLAKKKLYPAVAQLMAQGLVPKHTNVVGFARSAYEREAFLEKQCVNVEGSEEDTKHFLSQCSYFRGEGYDVDKAYRRLDVELDAYEADLGVAGNRLFFLSVPPTVFGTVCTLIHKFAVAKGRGPFTRCIIEKPFGRDSRSFKVLNDCTASLFREDQIFRIDHYLGKEAILNIMTLRFANQILEPLWSRYFIESVHISFKEDLGTGGRGGYFDGFGIIRDIMQNHLLQVFMLLAMEPPETLSAASISKTKTELLQCVETILPENCLLGQFGANTQRKGAERQVEPGYLDDETVPEGSVCPTFAATVMHIKNPRWEGVPFLITAGKGLDERKAEVRVTFRAQPGAGNALFGDRKNELVVRIQPDPAVYMTTTQKEPGLEYKSVQGVMEMDYQGQFGADQYSGDAYERMFYNAARGDGSLFVGESELIESWRIFTPLLDAIDDRKLEPPVLYPFGCRVPPGIDEFAAARGVTLKKSWHEHLAGVAAAGEAELKALFEQLDSNGSGLLELGEIAAFARQFYDSREPSKSFVKQISDRLGWTEGGLGYADFAASCAELCTN